MFQGIAGIVGVILASLSAYGWQHGWGPTDYVLVVILSPIFGFIEGLIGAALYNLAAWVVGGIKFEIADGESQSEPPTPTWLQRETWGEKFGRTFSPGQSPPLESQQETPDSEPD